MDRRGQRDESFEMLVGLVLLAEVAFAVLVTLVLGEPPLPVTTVGFGLAMAVVFALQHRFADGDARYR